MSRFPERIDSRRLVMRLWEDADAPALHEAIRQSLDHLRPWMDWIAGEPLTPAQRLGFVRHVRLRWEQDVEAIYGVFLDEAVIGGCGLHRRQGPRRRSRSGIGSMPPIPARGTPPNCRPR